MATRFTTPVAVPTASPGESGRSEHRPSSRSPLARARNSAAGAPPDTVGVVLVGGRVGMSSTGSRSIRPRLVTAATSPRAVARTALTSRSWLARRLGSGAGSGSGVLVRASSPVDESNTQHGSSATSSGVAVALVTGTPADSSSTVRRGVPNVAATSASSSETSARSSSGLARIEVSWAIVCSSSDFSCSSSSRLNRVNRRSGISRM